MAARECPVCERPVTGAVLCPFCTNEILKALADVPMLLAELDITATRQAKVAPRASGGRSAETPLPYGARASDAIRQFTSVLLLWAGAINPQGLTFTALTAAAHLRIHINLVRQHGMAEKIYDQVTSARAHAFEVIDRDPDLVPAGECGAELADGDTCTEILYGDPDRATVKCRCGAQYDMDRTWMLTAAREQQWTAAEIGRVTPGVTASMVRDYARRGLVKACGERKIGPSRTIPVYRVGDLLDLLTPAKESA
jgi:hypothetical protein